MRYLQKFITKDLNKKMVFIGGARQVGKTTLAETILTNYKKNKMTGIYLNWDYENDQNDILKMKWADSDKLIIFDELHKFKRWKSWLKGIYDKQKNLHQFLVTGSARLDVYRRSGDSLMGRYHYWRLHPFTLSEIPNKISPNEALKRLMTLGGFPEPFLDNNEIQAKRWRKERFDKIIKDDIRDLEAINDIQTLSLFTTALRERVSTPIVIANLVEDLKISHKTLTKWLQSLARMYMIFIVKPYTKNLPRAIQKPPRVYFYDNADVIGDEGAVFENLVACHLLKKIQFLEDAFGDTYELNYIRDKEKREVDFVIVKNRQVEELIEVKLSDEKPSKALMYYANKLKPKKATQIINNINRPFTSGNINFIDAYSYFKKDQELWT